MDRVEIPVDEIVALTPIAPGVRGLRITFVNVFGITHADPNFPGRRSRRCGSWTLIDTALPMSRSLIRNWAEEHFAGPPNAIVLSHGHFDHVSEAATLADEWHVPIYAHPTERPYLTGQREYPSPNPGAGGGMMSYLSPLLPKRPVDLGSGLRLLPEAEDGTFQLEEMPGWQSYIRRATPRDTFPSFVPNIACCFQPTHFVPPNRNPSSRRPSQPGELHGPPSYFTWDWSMAKSWVERLAAL